MQLLRHRLTGQAILLILAAHLKGSPVLHNQYLETSSTSQPIRTELSLSIKDQGRNSSPTGIARLMIISHPSPVLMQRRVSSLPSYTAGVPVCARCLLTNCTPCLNCASHLGRQPPKVVSHLKHQARPERILAVLC